MDGKRTSILSDLKRNYGDTKSISKSVDLSALENNANPHQIYNSIFKDVDTTPSDYPTEKMSVGDIVYINDNPNEQFEIILILLGDGSLINFNFDSSSQQDKKEHKTVLIKAKVGFLIAS